MCCERMEALDVKKAVKITNWVFVIGLVLIVLLLGVMLLQEYKRANTPQEPQLPMNSMTFWESFCLIAAVFLIGWIVLYGVARLLLVVIGVISK